MRVAIIAIIACLWATTASADFLGIKKAVVYGGVGKKPQIFVHDIWNEYAVIPQTKESDFSLAVGAGLHYWNGISRKSSSSTMGYMTADGTLKQGYNVTSATWNANAGWYEIWLTGIE